VAGAYQFPGADGVTPAAWTGDGLSVPACGPIPNDGGPTTPASLRYARLTADGWQFETLDGPGSRLSGHTGSQVGATVSVTDY
jgi:hypothetical protein